MTNIANKSKTQIECSAKTIKELGLPKQSLDYGDPEIDPFLSWYCHLILINRKKHLLFINTASRYPVFTDAVSRAEIKDLANVLAAAIKLQLKEEGVSDELTCGLIRDLANPKITKSNNRSIIGTAVDYERLLWGYFDPSLEPYNPPGSTVMGLILARTPILKMIPDCYPHRVFREQFRVRYGETGHFEWKREDHY
jgi:hypothetical protein